MRVLQVIDQLVGGGAEESLRQIILGTQGESIRHAVVVLKPERRGLERLEEVGIPTFVPAHPLRSRLSRLRHVLRAVRGYRPDLLHTTLAESDLAGRIAGKLTGIPVLTSLVGTPYALEAQRTSAVSAWKRLVVRAVDVVLSRFATERFHAVTELVAKSAVEHLRIRPDRIEVVPRSRDRALLGEPSEARRRSARQALGLGPQVPLLLNVGREEPPKGQVHALHALDRVRASYPQAVLLLAGRRGGASPALDACIAELRIAGGVRRLGQRGDVPELLCGADVFVFPSLHEGAAGAVLEAMALEVPVVAHDIPALRSILEGGLGLLVPVGDHIAFADAVLAVLNDPATARERARRARAHYERHYSLQTSLDGMRRLYRSLTGI
ncbi:MAG: glycosyltransferase [Egibacteraceae bacterium]